MAHTITCLDCGARRTTIYKNTRYCMSCRLLRDIEWLEPVERRCRSNDCTQTFLPAAKKDLYCGECAGFMTSHEGRCLFCKRDATPLHRGMSICTACVRDPGERPRVIAGLRSGQRKRKHANSSSPTS